MAWTAPRTWVASEVVTAALMNTHVRDNLLETAPAKAATAGYLIRVTGTNAIEEADPTDGAKLDGDHLDIDFTPTNYTPSTAPAEAADVDDLAAHLKGIDDELGVVANQKVWLLPDPDVVTGTTAWQLFVNRPAMLIGSSSADGSVFFSFTFPSNFTALTVADVYLLTQTGSGAVVRYRVDTQWGADGESIGANSDSIAATDLTMPTTASELEIIDITAAFTGIAAGDQIGIEFDREGSHANDTAGNVYIFGILLEYN